MIRSGSAVLSGSAESSLGHGHASSFRPLGSRAQAIIGGPVHALRLFGEIIEYVGIAAKS
jgi:hypothetical protein